MNIARCGVWPTPKHLIAVLVDENGNAHPPLCVARSDAARTALIHWLADHQYQGLVLTDDLICDPLVEGAIDARLGGTITRCVKARRRCILKDDE